VAIKVINHDATLSKKVDTLRESLVGISIQHPNVVRPLSLPPSAIPSPEHVAMQRGPPHFAQTLQSWPAGADFHCLVQCLCWPPPRSIP
jgi:hypothetical protein